MSQKTLFFIAAALLTMGFVTAVLVYERTGSPVEAGPGASTSGALIRDGAPVKGAADARVTIVEFLDPACGTCAQFYPLVRQLVEQSDGRVNVLIRYAPLHPGSDEVVKMLEAAHRQDLFWPALEHLFINQNRWVANHRADPRRALALLMTLPVDAARFEADLSRAEVNAAVMQDVSDGAALGVRATPEFFVNGRPLPSFGYQQLLQLVSEAVAEAY